MKLSEINIYPIKSLGGISLAEARIEERGLRFDRRRMLVDAQGNFLTQREFPKMATLKVSLAAEGLQIKDGNETLFVPFAPTSSEKIKVKVWSSRCNALLYDETINEWFSAALKTNCRLAFMPDESRRLVNPFYAVRKFQDAVSFADGYPFLLIGEGSLADLNARLDEAIPMNRFRPNFVVKNTEVFAEDDWKKVRIGETVFHVVKPCARCSITTIDQERGVSDGKEPLRTLAQYRLVKRAGKQKILFGQNLIAENFGANIKVGDRLEILETRRKSVLKNKTFSGKQKSIFES